MKKTISLFLILVILSSGLALAEVEKIKVEVNNQELAFDVEPVMVEDLVLVPLRTIFESLGLEVSWDSESRTVTGENKDTSIKLEIGEDRADVNGEIVSLEVPAIIIDDRSMVPVRFIGEAIGAEVDWDEDMKLVSINEDKSGSEDYEKSLTFSNLVDQKSQEEIRETMELAGISTESIDFFFEEVDRFNSTVQGKSLVKDGFKTIDSLEPEYDLLAMQEMWDAKYLYFIGYNCRIVTYDLMKDMIHIGKTDTSNSDWMVFDKYALENNPKDIFTQEEYQEFQTLYASIPTELTKDISVHLENVKEDWKNKEIEFSDEEESSIISVFFHDEEGYLFIGHMGILIPEEDGGLLFIEKLSFHAPYQAVKFDNRVELNDYLMNKYDISWNQPTADPFIMENDELLEGYRANPYKKKSTY